MAKQVIHVTQAEALSDFAALLQHIRAGLEVIIEDNSRAVAVLSPAPARPGRLLSEAIASAETRGSSATLDGQFARDLEEIIGSHREPLNPPAWE
jgi:antitoxin (DNA-binding transcriptional repressor) of toxin-antitoxin stability system